MDAKLMDEEWSVLVSLLPAEWRELAREHGAMRRESGAIRTPDALLQLLLLHVATGLSLKQAVVRGRVQGLPLVSDVALLKRLRSSEVWLREMSRRMFQSSRFAGTSTVVPPGRRLRAVDATTVEEPGATGTDWRVHYCIGLPELTCDFYELTDVGGGETYKRFPVSPGDIILADRGYCHREGVAHVLRGGGDVIVRLNSTSFPLLEHGGDAPFVLLEHLRGLEGCAPAEWQVSFEAHGRTLKGRLCALRKSKEAAERARKKIRQSAKKKGKEVRPDTLEFAEYIAILATLDQDLLGTLDILELYRARWQIEICFKRLKSLLQLGHLPKTSDESARAWIQGKLLTVMLTERLIDEARFFSPWGFDIAASQQVA